MTKRRAALLGVAVVGVTVYLRRRPRRAPVPLHAIPFAVGVLGATRTVQEVDLSPGAVYDGIAGFFGSVVQTLIGDIITPVADAISWAAGLLENWVESLWLGVVTEIGQLPGQVLNVVTLVEQQFANAEQYALTLYDDLLVDVDNIEATLGGFVSNTLDTLESDLSTLLEDAITTGGLLYDWVYDDVLQPLYDEVSDVLDLAVDEAVDAVDDLLSDGLTVGGALWGLIQPLVQGLIDDALTSIQDVIDVVNGAWDFLVWVANQGEQLWQYFTGEFLTVAGDELVNAILDSLDSQTGTATAVLDRLFA